MSGSAPNAKIRAELDDRPVPEGDAHAMTDSESDVSKALAAFGAPPLKYRSFTQSEITPEPGVEPEPDVEPPHDLAEPVAPPPVPPAPVPTLNPPRPRAALAPAPLPLPPQPRLDPVEPMAGPMPMTAYQNEFLAPELSAPPPHAVAEAPVSDPVAYEAGDPPLSDVFRVLSSRALGPNGPRRS